MRQRPARVIGRRERRRQDARRAQRHSHAIMAGSRHEADRNQCASKHSQQHKRARPLAGAVASECVEFELHADTSVPESAASWQSSRRSNHLLGVNTVGHVPHIMLFMTQAASNHGRSLRYSRPSCRSSDDAPAYRARRSRRSDRWRNRCRPRAIPWPAALLNEGSATGVLRTPRAR